jgi:hypothetical protein
MSDMTPPNHGGGGEETAENGSLPDERVDDALLDEVREQAETAPDLETLGRQDLQQDIRLKKFYAYLLPAVLAAQLAISDFLVIGYAEWGVGWELDPWVLNVWIAATVVQVIGIVVIVTKYLFPARRA